MQPLRRAIVLASTFAAAVSSVATAREGGSDGGPNIIYVLADDLGYGDLVSYGQKTLETPHLDRLAAEGMRFTRHYAGSTVCAPSRCVLMTGRHTGRCTVRGNHRVQLRPDDLTFATILRRAGYRTGGFGKWGIGHPPPLDDPERHGFDSFYGYINMYHAHNFYPEFLVRDGEKVALRNVVPDRWDDDDREGRGVASKAVDYAPFLIRDAMLDFIEANHSRPFFVFYALNIPHANNEGGSDEAGRGMEVPDFGAFGERAWPAPEKGFARMIDYIDRDVGAILATLKRLGIDERTIVFFSSDNGPHREGGHREDFFDSGGPLRGLKRDLYEGGVRVPLLVRWPGRVARGMVTDHVSGFQDMLPTVCDLVGVSPPPSDGVSFLPTLLGKPSEQKEHAYLYWEFNEQGGRRAILKDDWKGIALETHAHGLDRFELYRLSDDVGERRNLVAAEPAIVRELKRLMDEAHVPDPYARRRP